jgi:hypothetical protein
MNMRNRKNKGVRGTKNVRNTVGNKGIFFNRSTGNQGHIKLSPKAEANLRKVKEFMARKLKFVRAEEFAGKGKFVEILDVDTEAEGKFGPSVQIRLREPKNGIERIWNVSSVRALKAISPLLENGISLMRVWTTGNGMDTQYFAEEVGHQRDEMKKRQRKRNGHYSR